MSKLLKRLFGKDRPDSRFDIYLSRRADAPTKPKKGQSSRIKKMQRYILGKETPKKNQKD